MTRFLLGAAVLTCGALAVFVEPPRAAEQARNLPMNFEVRREGPVETCGKDCRTWVSAVGVITADTPREFAKFAQGRELRGALIALDSEGGSVHGAMALGRAVRALDMTTTVGRTVVLPAKEGKELRARLLPRADCESMCAFVLLAGTKRFVPPTANVRVHQIWLGDRRDDATAANYSAEDLMLVQRDIGRLAKYTVEMDGNIDLLELALRIPPWEPMRGLSVSELRRMGLSNSDELQDRSTTESVTTSAPSSTPPGPNAARRISTAGHPHRGWALVEASGRPSLRRQHPLTVEGEEIGRFDLTLACAEAGEAYLATYAEQRGTSEDKPGALDKVTLTMGGRVLTLDVGSSTVASGSQLTTTAAGVIPTALVKNLAEAGNRSVTVTTFTAHGKATTIRIGNSGLAQHYVKLAGSCGKTRNAALAGSGKPVELAPR
jgi:hypothetical protein